LGGRDQEDRFKAMPISKCASVRRGLYEQSGITRYANAKWTLVTDPEVIIVALMSSHDNANRYTRLAAKGKALDLSHTANLVIPSCSVASWGLR
jgi:hypothetical protein